MITKTYNREDALQDALNLLGTGMGTPEHIAANARRAEGFIKLALAMEKLKVHTLSGKQDKRAAR